jgi:hypothetical protein
MDRRVQVAADAVAVSVRIRDRCSGSLDAPTSG